MPEELYFPGSDREDTGGAEPQSAEVHTYDFRTPVSFTRENLKFITAIHAVFSRDVDLRLRYLPGVKIKLEQSGLEQQDFPSFMEQIPEPAVIFVLKMEPVGLVFFEMEAGGALKLVDVALGGRGNATRQELLLTGIEQDILESIIKRVVLPALVTAWKTCFNASVQILYYEVKARNLQPLLQEMCLIIKLQMEINGNLTWLRLCYPYSMLDPLFPRLTGEFNRPDVPASSHWRESLQSPTYFQQYVEFPLVQMHLTLTDILKWKNPAALGLQAGLVGTTRVASLAPEGVYYE